MKYRVDSNVRVNLIYPWIVVEAIPLQEKPEAKIVAFTMSKETADKFCEALNEKGYIEAD
jgi:hypothetical protein